MNFFMKKNENGFANSKNNYDEIDAYTKMMLYSIVEKLIVFYEVFLPEYKRFIKSNKVPARKVYGLMNKVTKNLAFRLRRTGVLVIADAPFANLRNKLCVALPFNKKRLFKKLALDLYKFSRIEAAVKDPFCNDNFNFDFNFTLFDNRDITVQVAEVDCSLITSNANNSFKLFEKQLESAFKKIETKKDLALFLSQFFNVQEDINDCFRIAKEAC